MSDDPETDRSRARARADEVSPDVARRVRALSEALHRDREQSFVRMLTRPGWLGMVPHLPSLRARRRDQARRATLNVAALAAASVGWILIAAWRAWL